MYHISYSVYKYVYTLKIFIKVYFLLAVQGCWLALYVTGYCYIQKASLLNNSRYDNSCYDIRYWLPLHTKSKLPQVIECTLSSRVYCISVIERPLRTYNHSVHDIQRGRSTSNCITWLKVELPTIWWFVGDLHRHPLHFFANRPRTYQYVAISTLTSRVLPRLSRRPSPDGHRKEIKKWLKSFTYW